MQLRQPLHVNVLKCSYIYTKREKKNKKREFLERDIANQISEITLRTKVRGKTLTTNRL